MAHWASYIAFGFEEEEFQKLLLELKDKISIDSISSKDISGIEPTVESGKDLEKRELVSDALVNLGFMKNDIERFLSSINVDEMEIEDIIKLSMKQL